MKKHFKQVKVNRYRFRYNVINVYYMSLHFQIILN